MIKNILKLNQPIVFFIILSLFCAFLAYKLVVETYNSYGVYDIGSEDYLELKLLENK